MEKTWKAICAGQSGIGRITKFDPTGYDAQIAGEVKDFDPAQFIEKKDIKKMDAFIHYAVGAAQLAADDAGLKGSPEEATKVGVYIGSGIGGLGSIEHYHTVLKEKGLAGSRLFFIPMTIINLASDRWRSGWAPRTQLLCGYGVRDQGIIASAMRSGLSSAARRT